MKKGEWSGKRTGIENLGLDRLLSSVVALIIVLYNIGITCQLLRDAKAKTGSTAPSFLGGDQRYKGFIHKSPKCCLVF